LKLPPAPRARQEPADKHRARLLKAYTDTANDGTCARVLGRPTRDGYRLTATNGHCALLERGEGRDDPLGYRDWSISPEARWVDLPPAFHLALLRVSLLANERSHAVTLAIADDELTIHAQTYEGEATERIGALKTSSPAPRVTVCLNAEYLDPACGVWPLRWYVRNAETVQLFAPAGDTYRALIMPMRT